MNFYIIINSVNDKRYIGVTSRTIQVRWKQHQRDAHYARSSSILHAAIRKHGIDKFSCFKIASALSMEALFEIEPALIAQYRTRSPFGYNMTNGGEGSPGHKVSAQTKMKISASHTGKKLTAEHRKKLSDSKIGKKLKRTAEHNKKISEARMGHGFSDECLIKMSDAKKGKPWTAARRAACK